MLRRGSSCGGGKAAAAQQRSGARSRRRPAGGWRDLARASLRPIRRVCLLPDRSNRFSYLSSIYIYMRSGSSKNADSQRRVEVGRVGRVQVGPDKRPRQRARLRQRDQDRQGGHRDAETRGHRHPAAGWGMRGHALGVGAATHVAVRCVARCCCCRAPRSATRASIAVCRSPGGAAAALDDAWLGMYT